MVSLRSGTSTALIAGLCLATATGCSSSTDCGQGADAPGIASSHVITGARLNDTSFTCVGFPEGTSSADLESENSYYAEFAEQGDTTLVAVADQAGRGYVIDVTVGGETIQMQEYSELRGRWFWKTDVYFASPVTFGAEPESSSSSPATDPS